jgi:hypothetical protein
MDMILAKLTSENIRLLYEFVSGDATHGKDDDGMRQAILAQTEVNEGTCMAVAMVYAKQANAPLGMRYNTEAYDPDKHHGFDGRLYEIPLPAGSQSEEVWNVQHDTSQLNVTLPSGFQLNLIISELLNGDQSDYTKKQLLYTYPHLPVNDGRHADFFAFEQVLEGLLDKGWEAILFIHPQEAR